MSSRKTKSTRSYGYTDVRSKSDEDDAPESPGNISSDDGPGEQDSFPGSPAERLESPPSPPSPPTTPPAEKTPVVDALQSPEHRKLLDLVDELRSHGISEFTSLPQLVVCGDQSSGKSSVLEAITEVPFPRRDNLCTRFATQIVLRRSPVTKGTVTIIPDKSRPRPQGSPIERVSAFARELDNVGQLPKIIDEAAAAMGIRDSGFSSDVLSLEISGPKRPQLTIVDLPGLIHTGSRAQSSDEVSMVSGLVKQYMNDERTIILAIVSGKSDIANQVVLTRALEVDPNGQRTMGIITKPDMLSPGSPSEDEFIRLASNKSIVLRLGWHVVRNRTYEERSVSFLERQQREEAFFRQGTWTKLPKDKVGIDTLRTRLSKVLKDHIFKELPRVVNEINVRLEECKEELESLGERRITTEEQRRFVTALSNEFQRLCEDALDGNYEHPFFSDTGVEEEDRTKRLRWAIQEMNEKFAERMAECGHTREIREKRQADPTSPAASSQEGGGPKILTRAEALKWVGALRRRCRGRELPGTFNPMLIRPLFLEQSQKWATIAGEHLQEICAVCREFLGYLLPTITNVRVAEVLYLVWVEPSLERSIAQAAKQFQLLLRDRERPPTTYDSHMKRIKHGTEERWKKRIEAANNGTISNIFGGPAVPPTQVSFQFVQSMVGGVDREADEQALDHLLAYYEVARSRFVDNLAVQVVERHIADELPEIISPLAVHDMSDETIAEIAAELPEDQDTRAQLEEKKAALTKAKGIIASYGRFVALC